MSRTFLIPVLMVLLVGVNSPGLATNIPTIELERAVHFLTPGEKDLLLQPGEYQVGAAEEWLELIPVVGDKKDAILIDAEVLPHEEEVPASQALSIKGENKDWHYVVLLLPGGRSLQALGTYTGIRPRSTEGLSRKSVHSQVAQHHIGQYGSHESKKDRL